MKLFIPLIIITITISSCLSSVPLVVNSPAAPNTNIVTSKNQIAGSAIYTTNDKARGENKATSNAIQADVKYAITNNIFLEAQIISQKETSDKKSFSGGRFVDTLVSKKNYTNKGYNFGAGFITSIGDQKKLLLFAKCRLPTIHNYYPNSRYIKWCNQQWFYKL